MRARACVRVRACVRARAYVRACVCARARARVCVCVSVIFSRHSVRLGQLLRCTHKRFVNIMKLYMQVELIRSRKKILPLFMLTFANRKCQRDSCGLDSRYDISLFDSNHFNYP